MLHLLRDLPTSSDCSKFHYLLLAWSNVNQNISLTFLSYNFEPLKSIFNLFTEFLVLCVVNKNVEHASFVLQLVAVNFDSSSLGFFVVVDAHLLQFIVTVVHGGGHAGRHVEALDFSAHQNDFGLARSDVQIVFMFITSKDFEPFKSGVVHRFSIPGFWILVFHQDEIVSLRRLITFISCNQRCLFAHHGLHLDIFRPLACLTQVNFTQHLFE